MLALSLLPTPKNRLLSALPADSLAQLWPQLTPVDLAFRQVLHLPEKPITAVYFLETAWVSMIATLEDGDAAEVGVIGYEGVAGIPVILGSDHDDLEAMVQCPGDALSIGTTALQEAMDADRVLRHLLLRYVLVHHGQVARTAACNGHHYTEQRLARWLLIAHDRSCGDDFPMTHELLGMMLAVRRAGVTVAAGSLQKAGLIRYERGRITITDRAGLENVSCECYGVVRRASDKFLSADDGGRSAYRR
ncbi:Crp/Fnr family transcriptional regulator [Roseomonas sp. BN140053]|uniref:Crp/Fnr family transcriptional regulator n=1 Tax=Roseomonas sp. BN140053 TaxID=3391898 RepID=UPI0039EC3386